MTESTLHPTLTIAVLSYNRSQFIEESVRSVLCQSYQDFQVLVVDNASTDQCLEKIQDIGDSRVTVVQHQNNIGAVGNMNYVLACCQSDYLILMHDDDRMKPKLVETYMNLLRGSSNVTMICCNADLISENGELQKVSYLSDRFQGLRSRETSDGGLAADYIAGLNYVICPTVLMNMKRVRAAGLRFRDDVGPATDSFFWCELSFQPGKFLYLEESLFDYRAHPRQDSILRASLLITKLRDPLTAFLRSKRPELASRWRKNSVPSVVREWLDSHPLSEKRPARAFLQETQILWKLNSLTTLERLTAILNRIPSTVVDLIRHWKRLLFQRGRNK